MGFDLGNLLQQYMGGNTNVDTAQAADHFDQVAQNAPREAVAQGVTQAFRSDQTPPFPQMLGQMFGNSNPNQRAGMLNQLLGSMGPGLLSSLAGGALGNLGGLGGLLGGGQSQQPQVTPEQASQMTPEQVQEIAAHAQQQNPGIVDRMGDFYAEHPTLVKTLGGAALAIALGHMAQGMQRR
jgi:hypothetical protein